MWSPHQPSSGGNWVRRRRWFRVLKKQMSIPDEIEGLPSQGFIDAVQGNLATENPVNSSQDVYREDLQHDHQASEFSSAANTIALPSAIGQEELLGNPWSSSTGYTVSDGVQPENFHRQNRNSFSSSQELSRRSTNSINPSSSPRFTIHFEESSAQSNENLNISTSFVRSSLEATNYGIRPNEDGNTAQNSTVLEDTSSARVNDAVSSDTSLVSGNKVWESDHNVHECRLCTRKFNLWLRRHHCRRCGRVICDKCSSSKMLLRPDQIVHDPTAPPSGLQTSMYHRVCDNCFHGLEQQ
ncbi:uncharacterized protein VTP21DRAFT_2383 [Calcarisporiella thermophila]|uniref:uncharacterized protein n=1 Tax=Calcarisporiella thermophila TaxID=911321 RepID=UPI0037420075